MCLLGSAVEQAAAIPPIRAACDIAGVDRVIIVGSQSILGSFDIDQLPAVTQFLRSNFRDPSD